MSILTTMWYTPISLSKEDDITTIIIDPIVESNLTLHAKFPDSSKYYIRKGRTDPFSIPFVLYTLASIYEHKLTIYTSYTEKEMRLGCLDNVWGEIANKYVSRQISLLSKIVFGKQEGLFDE